MNTKTLLESATARPWIMHMDEEWNVFIQTRDYSINFSEAKQTGEQIAEVLSDEKTQESNAALIVQAVNEYAALCAVAEALVQFTQCSQVRDIVSGDTELACAVIAARHSLSTLAAIRKGAQ